MLGPQLVLTWSGLRPDGGLVGKKHELREEIAALETRRALGMIGGPGFKMPDEYLIRIVVKVLRALGRPIDWAETLNRRMRRYQGSNCSAPVETFLEKVKKELGVERFPAGVKDRAVTLGIHVADKVLARLERDKTTPPQARRELIRENGTFIRAVSALKSLDWFKSIVRDSGTSAVVVGWRKYQYGYGAGGNVATDISMNPQWTASGQRALDAKISAWLDKDWYGAVYRRGIACVEGAFIVDAPSVKLDEAVAVGAGCEGHWPVCHRVNAAYRKVGFRLEEKKCWVEIGCGPPRFVRDVG